ncbi:MAG: hypothetical protein MK132_19875 [Lentisphaerales bacterium]|nr:hypothetical protein [Lentisphaerales bacterium]
MKIIIILAAVLTMALLNFLFPEVDFKEQSFEATPLALSPNTKTKFSEPKLVAKYDHTEANRPDKSIPNKAPKNTKVTNIEDKTSRLEANQQEEKNQFLDQLPETPRYPFNRERQTHVNPAYTQQVTLRILKAQNKQRLHYRNRAQSGVITENSIQESEVNDISSDTIVPESTNSIYSADLKSTSSDNLEVFGMEPSTEVAQQIPTETVLNTVKDSNFDFSPLQQTSINYTPLTTNGEIIPWAKFIITDQQENVILESFTNADGSIITNLPKLQGTTLYLKVLAKGFVEEKIQL